MKHKIKWRDMELAPETMKFQEWQDYLMEVACSVYGVPQSYFQLDIDRLHKVHFNIDKKERCFGHTFYACMCVLGYMDVLEKWEIIPIVLSQFTLITHFLNTLSHCMLLYYGEQFDIESIRHGYYRIKTSKSTHYLKFYNYVFLNSEALNYATYGVEPIIDHSKID